MKPLLITSLAVALGLAVSEGDLWLTMYIAIVQAGGVP
jgi:hypothetical protein